MKAVSSTFTGFIGGEPHHQRRHRDAVIHVGWRRGRRRARVPCPRRSDRRPTTSTLTPLTRSIAAVAFQAVGFLDAQFLQAAHDGGALGKTTPATASTRYSSIIEGAPLRRHFDAAQFRRRATRSCAIGFAGIAAHFALLDVSAHFAQGW